MTTVQEYLTGDFEADREYVDGELLERHSGEQPHSYAQGMTSVLLYQRERQSGARTLRIRCLRAVSIRSARSYCSQTTVPTPGEMHEVLDGILRTQHPNIEVPLAAIFEEVFEA